MTLILDKYELSSKVWELKIESQTLIGKVHLINRFPAVNSYENPFIDTEIDVKFSVTSFYIVFEVPNQIVEADIEILKRVFNTSYVHRMSGPGITGPELVFDKRDSDISIERKFDFYIKNLGDICTSYLSIECSTDIWNHTSIILGG